jgi:chromosome segregation ATPase
MAANVATWKAKLAAKIEARKAKAASSAEVDELNSLLSRVSMSSSVDELESLLGNLSMGGRRRTRKQKRKGKKRGGNDPADTRLARCREEVRELEEAVDRLRRQSRGGRTRKTRRGGVLPQRMTLTEAEEKYHQELEALKKTGNASPAEIAAAEKKWSDAYIKMRSVLGRPEPGYPHGQAFPRR